jgi:phage-related minor tail protein
LSGLYYDLFSGGTKSLWKDFERMGLEALAKLAAQKTFELVLRVASGGGLGGEIGSLLGIAPRASGGPVALGRTYLVGEKGPELFSPHTSGTIVPNHAIPQALPNVAPMMDMRAATPQVVSNRVFNINVSADHSVTPARFAGDLAQQILERAAQMDAQTLALGQRITPGMLRQAQVMKG